MCGMLSSVFSQKMHGVEQLELINEGALEANTIFKMDGKGSRTKPPGHKPLHKNPPCQKPPGEKI